MDLIKEGGLYAATFLYNPSMSASAVSLARLIAKGCGLTELAEPEVPQVIQLAASTVTKDNVDQFDCSASRARARAPVARPPGASSANSRMTQTDPTHSELRGIVKEFSGVRALDGVDLSGSGGEVLALVGENGAGKSTLINIIGGRWPHGTYEGRSTWTARPCRSAVRWTRSPAASPSSTRNCSWCPI